MASKQAIAINPTEAQEAHTLMQYMQARNLKFTHVKNETGRSFGGEKIVNWKAIYDYQDGVSAGFPDFVVVLPGIGLLCIELKRLKGSKTSPAQLEWIEALNTCPGVQAAVCYGADGGIALIEQFLPTRRS